MACVCEGVTRKMTEQKTKTKYMLELSEKEMLIISATGLISSISTRHQEFFDSLDNGGIEKTTWAQAMLTLLNNQSEWESLVERMEYYVISDGVDT